MTSVKSRLHHPIEQPASTGLRRLAECLLLALVYGGAARLSQVFAIAPGNISPVWLPSGIALAAVLLRGYRLWPGIFLGAFAGNIWAFFSSASAGLVVKCLLAAIATGIGDSLGIVVAVWLIQWPGVTRHPLHGASDMIRLISYGGVLGTGISAVCGVGSLGLAGILPWSQTSAALWTWWIGDSMGVLVLTPLLLAWHDGFRDCRFGREELAAIGCLAGLGLWLSPQDELALLFLALPPLMWVVYRCDSRVAISLLAAFAAINVVVLGFGRGPFQGESQNMNLIRLQLLLATFIAPMLVLHAALDDRKLSHGGERPTRAILAAVGLVLAAGIVATGTLYYRTLALKAYAAIQQELKVIAQFKVDQLEHYRRARLADGRAFFHNPAFAALAKRMLETPADADACRELQAWLGKYQSVYQYNRVCLLDSQGVTRMAVPGAAEPVAALIAQQVPAILGADRVVWQDFYRNEINQNVYLAVMVPIFDEAQPALPPLGVLMLRIDPDTYLNPLIQRWPKASPTAETLLLRWEDNDALYLNALRFRPNAALNLRVSLQQLAVPSVNAVSGHVGFFRGADYRGVPVLSSALAVPDSPWVLVTKVDTAEAEAPMRPQFWQVFGVVGILLFSVAGGAGLVWWQQLDRFHRERMMVAEALNTSEARFRQLFEGNAMPVAFWNTEGLFTDANDAWCKVIDIDRVQVRAGKVSWKAITPPEMQARDLAAIREIQAVGTCQPYEKDFIRPDGSRVTVLLMGGSMLVGSSTEGVAFAVDLTERKQAEAALAKIHRLLLETEEVGKVGGWEFDVDTHLQTWTEEIYRIHELDGAYDPTLHDAVSFYAPETRPVFERAVKAAVEQGESFDLELEIITAKGNLRCVKVIGHADLEHHRVYGFFQDITERKQAEAALQAALAEKVTLLKEIHHRVKNNLQIISSLMHLQSSRIASAEAKAVLLEMQDRVRAMALIHEHLYRSDNLAAVDLAPYLRSLCTQLVRSAAATSGSIHLQMDLAPVQLEIDKAIPCGLLVNELVTNAIKYAFPLGRHGVLRVDLQLLDGTPGWCLRVADDGVGLPTDFDLQKLTSLGLKVVADLAHQLGGRLSIGSGPGAVFEVEFHGDGGSATTG